MYGRTSEVESDAKGDDMSKGTHLVLQDGKFVSGGVAIRSGCHHSKGLTACGACYARLMWFLEQVVDGDDGREEIRALGEELTDCLRAERKQ